MRKLVWSLQAETDLYEIADTYSLAAPNLDEELLGRIFGAPRVLCDYPFLGEDAGTAGLRKWLVRQTPFILLYRVTPDSIEGARVVAAASDWRDD